MHFILIIQSVFYAVLFMNIDFRWRSYMKKVFITLTVFFIISLILCAIFATIKYFNILNSLNRDETTVSYDGTYTVYIDNTAHSVYRVTSKFIIKETVTDKVLYTTDENYLNARFFWSEATNIFWIGCSDVGDSAILITESKIYLLEILTHTDNGFIMYCRSDEYEGKWYSVLIDEKYIPELIKTRCIEIEQMDGYISPISENEVLGAIVLDN